MMILDGKLVSQLKLSQIQKRAVSLTRKMARKPGLAVVLIGDDPASQVYVRNKVKTCEEHGLESFLYKLPAKSSEKEVLALITKLNKNKKVDGILVQLPTPKHLNGEKITEHILPEKDVDGLTTHNQGLLLKGQYKVAPCTPSGVMEILKHYDIDVVGKNCVVIGRSSIVGKPMALLLLAANATVTIAHSKSKNLSEITRSADIVVVAAGRPNFFGKKFFNENAIVIDVGIHRLPTGLCGDVNFKEASEVVKAITPVPGGVGPMTITQLLMNTLILAENNFKA
jgi:methylenetetrahydrofolate dehydrogenase (NADP+)/methenyltetrahydrofolate cyclohydrolase